MDAQLRYYGLAYCKICQAARPMPNQTTGRLACGHFESDFASRSKCEVISPFFAKFLDLDPYLDACAPYPRFCIACGCDVAVDDEDQLLCEHGDPPPPNEWPEFCIACGSEVPVDWYGRVCEHGGRFLSAGDG